MATSLASQLKRLEAPQTSVFRTRKGRHSFLYSRSEAAGIGCDTHYSIALDGLSGLIELDPGLEQYRSSLLSESSKSFERGVRGQEENETLDQELECLLLRLITPFFIRVDSHKVLEYLIYKYRVNVFNVDALIVSALPYHGTSLFPKLLQAIPPLYDVAKKWSFLKCVQEQGSPITRNVLVNRCLGEQWLIQLIADATRKEVTVSEGKSGKFATFANSIFLSCLISAGENENLLTAVQSFIDGGLSSSSKYYVLSAYTVTSFACSKLQFVESFLKKLLSRSSRKFMKYEFRDEIVQEFVLLIAVILSTQQADVSSLLPESAVTIMVENMDLIVHAPRVVNALIRKLATSLSEDNLSLLLNLLTAPGVTPDRGTVSLAEKSLRPFSKKNISSQSKIPVLQVVLCLLRTRHSSVKRLTSVVREGESVALLIDQLTLVGGVPGEEGSHRIPLNLKRQEWKDVAALLELVTGRKIKESGPLLEQCQMLLRESLAYEESADMVYYRRLLLKVIHQIITAEDFDWTGEKSPLPDTSCIIDMMKAFRHQEGVRECLKIIKVLAKHRRAEILENYMRVFSFVGCKYGNCDDQVSLSLMDMILCDLVPSLTAGDENLVRKVIDSLIVSIFAVASHRRLVILNRFLQVAGLSDIGYDYVVFSLFKRSVRNKTDKMRKFYCQFCAQLLSSFKLADASRYVEQLLSLLIQPLFPDDVTEKCFVVGGGEREICDQKEASFASLIVSLQTDHSITAQNLSDAASKILIKTFASDDYVRKVQCQSGATTSAESGVPADTQPVNDGSLMPVINKLVDHIIAIHEKGKMDNSIQMIHELVQNATLSLPVKTFMNITARLLLQSCKTTEQTSANSDTELAKLAISIIWMNRDRITDWQDRDSHLLFQCASSLARMSCVSLRTLSSSQTEAAASTCTSVSGKDAGGKEVVSGEQSPQCLQLRQSLLSMLKLLLREVGEVSEAEQRRFLAEILLIFLDWIDGVMATAPPEQRKDSPENLIPWVTLAATQIMKSLGSEDGKKHVPRFTSTLSRIQQSG